MTLSLAACGGGGGGDEGGSLADLPENGFATDTVLVVHSRDTTDNIAILSVDTDSGSVGILPNSPADLGVPVGDVRTLASHPASRRVFCGSSVTGRIAVFEIEASGEPEAAPDSPFEAEAAGVSSIEVSANGDSIYVGYRVSSRLSRYDVAANGALSLAQSVTTGPHADARSMRREGDVLYVAFSDSSSIVGYRLDGDGAFEDGPAVVDEIATNRSPESLAATGNRLYCSLGSDDSVDAFDIEADGTLTRLTGAPYSYPGLGAFRDIVVQPGGNQLAVGADQPDASVGLYSIEADGSLTRDASPLRLSGNSGAAGMSFTDDGNYLYVCNDRDGGLYIVEVGSGSLLFASPSRVELPGTQVDVLRVQAAVIPNEGSALLRIAGQD